MNSSCRFVALFVFCAICIDNTFGSRTRRHPSTRNKSKDNNEKSTQSTSYHEYKSKSAIDHVAIYIDTKSKSKSESTSKSSTSYSSSSYSSESSNLNHKKRVRQYAKKEKEKESMSSLSNKPSYKPTKRPIFNLIPWSTIYSTLTPTQEPNARTYDPTSEPTFEPSKYHTTEPTSKHTDNPTYEPTSIPSNQPTISPTSKPTLQPLPIFKQTPTPTLSQTSQPTLQPTTKHGLIEMYLFYDETNDWKFDVFPYQIYSDLMRRTVYDTLQEITGYSMIYGEDEYSGDEYTWIYGGIINYNTCYIFNNKVTSKANCPGIPDFDHGDAMYGAVVEFGAVTNGVSSDTKDYNDYIISMLQGDEFPLLFSEKLKKYSDDYVKNN